LAARIRRRHVRLGKKRGDLIGPTKRGKGTKIMLLVDGAGLPLAIDVDSASPAEVGLIEPLLDQAVTEYLPQRLVYDRAADSDTLRDRLAQRGIELICPHRKGRVRPATQDGRSCVAIGSDGSLSARLAGSSPFEGWSPATSSTRSSFTASPNLPVS
jgi:hypothetical protein